MRRQKYRSFPPIQLLGLLLESFETSIDNRALGSELATCYLASDELCRVLRQCDLNSA